MDFGLLTSKCCTIPGRMVIPRRATVGITITCSSILSYAPFNLSKRGHAAK